MSVADRKGVRFTSARPGTVTVSFLPWARVQARTVWLAFPVMEDGTVEAVSRVVQRQGTFLRCEFAAGSPLPTRLNRGPRALCQYDYKMAHTKWCCSSSETSHPTLHGINFRIGASSGTSNGTSYGMFQGTGLRCSKGLTFYRTLYGRSHGIPLDFLRDFQWCFRWDIPCDTVWHLSRDIH